MSKVKPQMRVFAFLEQLAKETSVSKGKARLELARKLNERSRHIQKRRKQRDRMRRLAKDLSKSEAGSAADATKMSCISPNIICRHEPVVCGARSHDNIYLSHSVDNCGPSGATDSSCMSKHCNTADALVCTTQQPKAMCADAAIIATHGSNVPLCANEASSDIVCDRASSELKDVFRCDRCSKVFKQRRSYDNHVKKHSGILPYDCMECDKQFASKDTLGKHIKTHQNITRLECLHTECGKTFKTRFALKEHLTVVHGTKSWRCAHSGCKKAYATEKDLRSHAIAHTSKHKCKECGKTFRDRYNLAMHQDTHTGVKNEACPLCDYRCVQKNSLNGHMRKKHPNCDIHTVQ